MYFVRCYNEVIFNVFYKKNVDWNKVNLIECKNIYGNGYLKY